MDAFERQRRDLPAGLVVLGAALLVAWLAGCPHRTEAKPDFTGRASFYGAGLEGQTTASGEPFDPDALTAAHRDLPFGSRLEVWRLDDGRTVEVTVNDRGPADPDRVLDLSRAAAKRLGMREEGVVEVGVRVLSRGAEP